MEYSLHPTLEHMHVMMKLDKDIHTENCLPLLKVEVNLEVMQLHRATVTPRPIYVIVNINFENICTKFGLQSPNLDQTNNPRVLY